MRYIVPFVLYLLSMTACNDTGEIGAQFFEDSNIRTVSIDSTTIVMKTVTFEELSTVSTGRILIGTFEDTDLGTVSAQPFLELSPAGSDDIEEINTQYLKTTLSLVYDTYSYYDTLLPAEIQVFSLSERMELNDDNTLYNTSSFNVLEELGSVVYNPRPNRGDTVEIPLDDALGMQLYTLAKSGSEIITNRADFQDFLRGITIKSAVSGSAVTGFSPKVLLRVHYSDKSVFPADERWIEFSCSSDRGDLYFTRIVSDRSETKLGGLSSIREPIASTETSGRSYIQGGSGLGLRIEMPHIREVSRENANVIITSATLFLHPDRRSYRRNARLPESLTLYYVDKHNQILSSYTSASLITDPYGRGEEYYAVNVLPFINAQLSIEEFNNNALLLTLENSEFTSSVTRLYADSPQNNSSTRVELKILTVNNN
jgi:hypothetical protein